MKLETGGDLRAYLATHEVEDSAALMIWAGRAWEAPLVANKASTFNSERGAEVLLFGRRAGEGIS